MYVSLKDKENTVVRQRISQLIEPIKSSRVAASRSQRKVLQQLFPPEDNAMFERESVDGGKGQQNIVVACSDTKSTQRMECRRFMDSENKNIDGTCVAVLERELSQTRAVARLDQNNMQKKIENLTEHIELLEQQNSSLITHNRRLKERNEVQQNETYELQRRLINKEAELLKEFEGRLSAMAASIQQKDIELMELRTNSSKYRVDTNCTLQDARREIDTLRRNLAQRDFRFAQMQAKYSLGKVELEAKMIQYLNDMKETCERLEQERDQLRQQLGKTQIALLADKARISEVEGQLEVSFVKYKALKAELNDLSDLKSKKDELERNQKKLVRKCQLLEQKIVQKNERVNEIILNYESQIEGLKDNRQATSLKQKSTEQSKIRQALEQQLNILLEERNSHSARSVLLTRQLQYLTTEMNSIREQSCYEMRLKDDRIALLDRQLMERDMEIQRLMKHQQELQTRCNDIIVGANQPKPVQQSMEYNVSYHMHSTTTNQRQSLRRQNDLPKQHINSSQYLQQKSVITQLQLQLDSTTHSLQSAEEQLMLKNSEILEMSKVIESQLMSLRQTKRLLDEKEEALGDRAKTINRLESEIKRQLTTLVELQLCIKEQQTCRNGFIERYGISLEPLVNVRADVSHDGTASAHREVLNNTRTFYNRLRERMADLESIRTRLLETTHKNGYLQQQTLQLTSHNVELNQRLHQLEHNKQLNEQLIIRIEQQSKCELQRVRTTLEQKYEVLYQKYIKYRRILQKQKERKELQKVIIKDSNQFNDEIVERCKELLR